MITSYVLIFLTLFAIIGNGFVQKYLHHKINDSYSPLSFETYVHRARPHMICGLDMRSLVKNDELYCQIFEDLISYVYKNTTFYYEDLANDLLILFQQNITFDQSEVKKGKHYFEKIDDLNTLFVANEDLNKAYCFLMRGSAFENNSGYPSLKTFFYPKKNNGSLPILNLFDMPLKLIGAMFKEEVEKDVEKLRIKWKNIEPSLQEEKVIVDNFLSAHRLRTHKYHNLIDLKIRSDKKLE